MWTLTYEELNRITWIGHQLLALTVMSFTVMQLFIIQYRIIQKNVRIDMAGICYLILGCLAVSIFSYLIPVQGGMMRYSRYLLLALELVAADGCFLLITFIGRLKSSRKARKVRNFFFLVLFLAILFIMTNDLHEQVFEYEYRGDEILFNYNWGGVAIVIAITLLDVVAALVLCIQTIRNQTLAGTIWLGIFASFAVLYIVVQIVPYLQHMVYTEFLPWNTDRGLYISVLSLLYINVAIRSRLIPINKNYFELFENSQLKLVITDEKYNICFKSNEIRSVDIDLLQESVKKIPEPYTWNENQMIYAARIPKGYAFYAQDVTDLKELQKETESTVEKLKKLNEILALENSRKRSGAKNKISLELMQGLNQHISSKTVMLSQMVRKLAALPAEEEGRWLMIARIVLLLVDIKRHCILFFLGRQSSMMPADELVVYLDEMAEFASYANIRCLTTNRIKGEIKVDDAVYLYEFFYHVINEASRHENVILIEELEKNKDKIEMHILASFTMDNLESMREEIFGKDVIRNVHLACKELDDVNDISLEIPLERGM